MAGERSTPESGLGAIGEDEVELFERPGEAGMQERVLLWVCRDGRRGQRRERNRRIGGGGHRRRRHPSCPSSSAERTKKKEKRQFQNRIKRTLRFERRGREGGMVLDCLTLLWQSPTLDPCHRRPISSLLLISHLRRPTESRFSRCNHMDLPMKVGHLPAELRWLFALKGLVCEIGKPLLSLLRTECPVLLLPYLGHNSN